MANGTRTEDPIVKELKEIKRLLMLRLKRDGVSQSEIASALGVAQSSISRTFSGGAAPPRTRKKPKR